MSMRLDAKVHNYKGHAIKQNVDPVGFDIIADSIAELSSTGLRKFLLNPKQELKERVRIHNENAQRAAEKLRDKKLDGLKTPFTIEAELDSGKYYLAKLSTKDHFENESAWLKHCLGTTHVEDYLAASDGGASEYFTIRERWATMPYDRRTEIFADILLETPESIHKLLPDAPRLKGLNTEVVDYITHPDNEKVIMGLDNMPDVPVVTIEYWPASKTINQIKTYRDGKTNALVTQSDPFKRAVTESIVYLRSGTAHDASGKPYVRGVEIMGDLGKLMEKGKLLLADGRAVSPGEAAEANPNDVINFAFDVTQDIPAYDLARLCERIPLSFDFSKSSREQRSAIRSVKGSIYHSWEGREFDYESLETIDGNLTLNGEASVRLPKLLHVGGTMKLTTMAAVELVNLKSVGKDAMFGSTERVDLPLLESVGDTLDAPDAKELLIPCLKSCKKIKINNQDGRVVVGNDEIRKKLSTR